MPLGPVLDKVAECEYTPESIAHMDRQCTEYAFIDGRYVPIRDREEVGDEETDGQTQ